MLLNHLGCHWHGRRFGRGLPGLVDQVQVAVHPSHLVERKGVCAGIICRRKRLCCSVWAQTLKKLPLSVSHISRPLLTWVTHVVIKRCSREMSTATGFIPWFRIVASFVFGGGVGVSTQVPSLHWGLSLQTCIIARFDLWYTSKHMVKPETVADLMNHCVSVAKHAIKWRVQHNSTYKNRVRGRVCTVVNTANTPVCTQHTNSVK